MDFATQVRFGYTEPDDAGDDLPVCPTCGHEFTHQPSYAAGNPADPDLFWTCPVCHADYSADEVYP